MEKHLKIKVSEKYFVHGRMSGTNRQPLFIVVHGLPGSMDEDLYLEATRWFAAHGYATFRFNLYGAEKDSRQLVDSTLETHASDIDTIVRYFRKKRFGNIYLAGHSYGGPSILLSKDQKFDAVCLWDPSYKVSFIKTNRGVRSGVYIKEIGGYVMNWGINFVIGKRMAEEADGMKWSKLTKDFHVPLRIIAAGNGSLVSGAQQYLKSGNAPKELTIVKGATHYFNDKAGMRENVFGLSDAWFKKH